MDSYSKVWYVWQPQSGPPTKTHSDRQSAIDEAARLAKQNRGRRFLVLESVCHVVVDEVQIVRHGEDLPF